MLFEIFLHRLLRFRDIDRENDQAFAGKFLIDLLDQSFFVLAIPTPRGPEVEEHDFAFDGVVVESLAGQGFRMKTWSGLAVVVTLGNAMGSEHQGKAKQKTNAGSHGAKC
jgi:hypothetical protein